MTLQFRSQFFIMTPSFPPVDDFIARISQVEWRKQWRHFILIVATICAICVAVVSYIARHLRVWYHSGGKNDCVLFTRKLRKILRLCYHWVVNFIIPEIIKFCDTCVTVWKVAQGGLLGSL